MRVEGLPSNPAWAQREVFFADPAARNTGKLWLEGSRAGAAAVVLASRSRPRHLGGVKVPHIIIAQIIRTLHDIFVDRRYSDKAVEFAFKNHPKWGSRDRRLFAESVYECVRHWRWLWHVAGLPDAEHARRECIGDEQLWSVWAAQWLLSGKDLPSFDELAGIRAQDIRARSKEADHLPAVIRLSLPDWLDARCARSGPGNNGSTRTPDGLDRLANQLAAVLDRNGIVRMDQTFGGFDPGPGGQFQQAVARSGDIQHAQWDQTD